MEVEGEAAGEVVERGLEAVIGEVAGGVDLAVDGTDVDDGALAARQAGGERAGEERGGAQVDGIEAVPGGGVSVGQGAL